VKFGGKQRNWLTIQVPVNYILSNECSVPCRNIIGCKWAVKDLSEAVGKAAPRES